MVQCSGNVNDTSTKLLYARPG